MSRGSLKAVNCWFVADCRPCTYTSTVCARRTCIPRLTRWEWLLHRPVCLASSHSLCWVTPLKGVDTLFKRTGHALTWSQLTRCPTEGHTLAWLNIYPKTRLEYQMRSISQSWICIFFGSITPAMLRHAATRCCGENQLLSSEPGGGGIAWKIRRKTGRLSNL